MKWKLSTLAGYGQFHDLTGLKKRLISLSLQNSPRTPELNTQKDQGSTVLKLNAGVLLEAVYSTYAQSSEVVLNGAY